ncbi:MAG: DUF924 domain-containing protein [Burkholderiales bacterium]|nr:DUF924 domain-containing protein [Burkholderiales bacterium]
MDASTTAILDFWFGAPGAPEHGSAREVWFRKDPAFDAEIRQRFGDAVGVALAGGFGQWCVTAQGALARVLLLDQFTRNIFRDTPRAFAGDARALATAEDAVTRGLDRELDRHGRAFLYLPFEHAEDTAIQHRSLALFGALAAETGDDAALQWARKHADVIFRFGRYPHRNEILGRTSTPEELAFLSEPGSRF